MSKFKNSKCVTLGIILKKSLVFKVMIKIIKFLFQTKIPI